jgi:hypothetical protein
LLVERLNVLAEQSSGGGKPSCRPDLDNHRLSRHGALKHVEICLVFGSGTQPARPHVFDYADDLGILVLRHAEAPAERAYAWEIPVGDGLADDRHQKSVRFIAGVEIAP